MTTLAEVLREQRKRQDEREADAVRRMTTLYNGLASDLESRLYQLDTLIQAATRNGVEPNATWLYQQARYRVLLDDVNALADLYATQGDRVLRDARYAEILAGRWDANERMDISSPDINPINYGVNQQAVERAADALVDGSPVREVLAQWGNEYTSQIEQGLLNGIANGHSADKITREIMQNMQGVASRWKVQQIVRTEGMRAYNQALIDQYEQVPEVAGYRWTAARGTRTCLACLALDSEVFAKAEDIPGRHVSCRCSISPMPQNLYPSVQRYLDQRGSSEDWLRKQQPAAIRKHFSSDRAYNAFMSGEVGLRDFLGTVDHPVYGKTVTQLSARQVLGDRP